MEKIKCLITDDEPIARQIVRNYCQQLDFLEVVGECENAMETLAFLRGKSVDVMFLDINMPVLNGLSLLKTLTQKPKIVLTTAYKDYAIDAFELEVTDYLLKPFSFERFLKAIQKIQTALAQASNEQISAPQNTPANAAQTTSSDVFEGIFLKIGKVIYRFSFQSILFCEAQQNYSRIVTTEQDIRIYQPLSQIEEQLPIATFVRTHRSFIVNKNQVTKIDGNRIYIGKHEIPIGANYRDLFMEQIGMK